MEAEKRFDPQSLIEYCVALYEKVGVPRDEGFLIANSLVEANLRGVYSHGVSRMPIYMKRLKAGDIRKKAEWRIEAESPSGMVVDAGNSMGYVVGVRVMERLVEKARETGVAMASIKHSTHFGMTAYMTDIALKHDMIGIALSNSPASMAPWGGKQSFLGTNPLCVSVPAGEAGSVTLDMATAVAARGKIIAARDKGEEIPAGWALDKNGRVTTNAQEGLDGTVMPLGGIKGYGLAFMIDVLSSALSGGAYGPQVKNLYYTDALQNFSHNYSVVNISKFIDIDLFKAHVDRMVKEVKAVPRADGVNEIFVPGEIELRNKASNLKRGVALPQNVVESLQSLGIEYGVPCTIKEL